MSATGSGGAEAETPACGAAGRPLRLLVLCTHNSARSQMGEGWLRHHADRLDLDAEVWSAGTEATRVKPDAVAVMAELGLDISGHASKTLWDVPDPWSFDVVLTVCDDANESCPAYPAAATRLHVSFPDPSGQDLEAWRSVRDALDGTMRRLAETLAQGRTPREADLVPDADRAESQQGEVP
ncbi:MAG: arsenate reductase ArsC [Trueperaceae bacterium]|nr:arsenate reductase ArsC [Trueperaceae bacterium]